MMSHMEFLVEVMIKRLDKWKAKRGSLMTIKGGKLARGETVARVGVVEMEEKGDV